MQPGNLGPKPPRSKAGEQANLLSNRDKAPFSNGKILQSTQASMMDLTERIRMAEKNACLTKSEGDFTQKEACQRL